MHRRTITIQYNQTTADRIRIEGEAERMNVVLKWIAWRDPEDMEWNIEFPIGAFRIDKYAEPIVKEGFLPLEQDLRIRLEKSDECLKTRTPPYEI